MKALLALLFSVILLSSAQGAPSLTKNPNQKILINADFMERDNEKGISILRDNVQVVFDQNYISCNEAIVLWSKNEVIAVGNVLMKSGKSTIQADKIVYNFENEKGHIYGGVILSGQILLQGEYIEKTGPDKFIVNDAYLTSCTTCPTSWSFTADRIDATMEGYAFISNPWLNFLEFPTLYMPYLIVPLKNERQTGVLTPSFGQTNRDGLSLDLPFFWAINRSQDLTLTPRYLSRRGVQLLTNYRYMLSEKSSGEFNGGWLTDKASSNRTRWFTTYSHYFDLPNDYIQRTTVNLTSDVDYVKDFQYHFNFVGESALDTRTSITKNHAGYHVSLDTSYYLSLIQNSIDESKENSVHRLPEIRFSITDKRLFQAFPLYFKFDSQYINLARSGNGFDTLQPDGSYSANLSNGIFNPNNDKVRTGQRLDLQPHLYATFRLFGNRVDFTPFLSYRHTQYLLGAQSDLNPATTPPIVDEFDIFPRRSYATYGVNTSTEFSRVYTTEGKTSFRHSIIPELSFQAIPQLNQTNHPFFGSQDQIPFFLETQPLQNQDLTLAGRGLQFDYEDRVIGRRLLNLAISNRIVTKNEWNSYDQAFLFRVSQAYDMQEADKPNGIPWQDIRTFTSVRWRGIDSITETFTFPNHKVTNVTTRLRTSLTEATFAEVIYSNYLNIPARPIDVKFNERRESAFLSAGANVSYITISGNIQYSFVESEFKSWLISTALTPPGRCWNFNLDLFKVLDADNFGTKVGFNFLFGS